MSLELLFLASVAAAQPSAPQTASEQPQTVARAQVHVGARIVSGAQIQLGLSASKEGYSLSDATIRLEDGSTRPARLVEFQ